MFGQNEVLHLFEVECLLHVEGGNLRHMRRCFPPPSAKPCTLHTAVEFTTTNTGYINISQLAAVEKVTYILCINLQPLVKKHLYNFLLIHSSC